MTVIARSSEYAKLTENCWNKPGILANDDHADPGRSAAGRWAAGRPALARAMSHASVQEATEIRA